MATFTPILYFLCLFKVMTNLGKELTIENQTLTMEISAKHDKKQKTKKTTSNF